MFGSAVAIAFKVSFALKYMKKMFFHFFKNYFWHQHIKTIQKYKKK